MKLLFFFFLLNYYFWKRNIQLYYKSLSFIFSFSLIIEYFFIFMGQLNSIYIIFLYKYNIKEYYIYLKKKSNKNNFFYRKFNKKINKKVNNKNNIINKILSHYNYRNRYLGFTIVYMQMFRRWLKEKKNDIIYLYIYKWIRNYNVLKKKIIKYTLLFFFFCNYKLAIFFDNLKKKLFNIIIVISFIELYYISLFLNKIYNIYLIIKKKIKSG